MSTQNTKMNKSTENNTRRNFDDRRQNKSNNNSDRGRQNDRYNADGERSNKTGFRDTAMRQALRPIRNQLPSLPILNRLDHYAQDGEDHINVERSASTPLGRALSIYDNTPFIHPVHGNFINLAGFQAWLLDATRDDTFRRKRSEQVHNQKRANDRGYAEQGIRRVPVDNVDYEVSLALWYKIRDNDKLLAAIYENNLPFDCYYVVTAGVVNPVRQRPVYGAAYAQGLAIIQKAIHMGVEPTDLVMLARQRNRPLSIVPKSAVATVEEKPIETKKPQKKEQKEGKLTMQVDENTGVMTGQYDDGEINNESRSITGLSPVDGLQQPEEEQPTVKMSDVVNSVVSGGSDIAVMSAINNITLEGDEPDAETSNPTDEGKVISNDDGSPLEVSSETAKDAGQAGYMDGEQTQEPTTGSSEKSTKTDEPL